MMKKKKKAIPSKPRAENRRALSDDELKKVAGGARSAVDVLTNNELADEIAAPLPKRK